MLYFFFLYFALETGNELEPSRILPHRPFSNDDKTMDDALTTRLYPLQDALSRVRVRERESASKREERGYATSSELTSSDFFFFSSTT